MGNLQGEVLDSNEVLQQCRGTADDIFSVRKKSSRFGGGVFIDHGLNAQ